MSARLQDVLRRDTAANRPAATAVPVGTLFFATDTGVVTQSDGTNWQTYSASVVGGDVAGPGTSVDKEIALFDGTGGDTLERATGTGIVRVSSGVYGTPGDVDLTTEVTGALPIANGGTGQTTQTAGMDALSPTTTKGDILVDNGTNVIRLAVGTDDQVLTANSGAASGLSWADAGGGSGSPSAAFLHTKWWGGWAVRAWAGAGGPPTINDVNGNLTVSAHTAGSVLARTKFYGIYQNASAGTGAAGFNLVTTTGTFADGLRYSHRPTADFYIRTDASDIGEYRVWVGFTSNQVFGDSDSQTGHVIAFRFSTAAGDTNWMCVTRDGSTTTAADSGVAVAADTEYRLTISFDGTNAVFSIDESEVESTTTTLPTTTNIAFPAIRVWKDTTAGAEVRSLGFSRMIMTAEVS